MEPKTLFNAKDYPSTQALISAIDECSAHGTQMAFVASGGRTYAILPPEATRDALMRRAVDHWLTNPDIIGEITRRIEKETPEDL